MYNQCLVLVVSYFASAVRDLFVDALMHAALTFNEKVWDEELRLRVSDLLDDTISREQLAAEAIADAPDHSWQDMQSIGRAFSKYFGRAPERSPFVNDIITAQALRHAIVHAGARVDKRLLAQVKKAQPRSLCPALVAEQQIRLTTPEVRLAGASMIEYLQQLAKIVTPAI